MSLLDQAMTKLERMIDRKVADVAPFRATVASVASGMATIKRLGVTTAETESRALVYGFMPAVNDEVLCVLVNGKPVVVGIVKRATGPMIYTGAGSPEGSITAEIGSIYLRNNGASGTIIYEKASGSGNTGWVANAASVDAFGYLGVPAFFPLDARSVSTTATDMVTNETFAMYMGRADAAYTSISMSVYVVTAAATITWAEVAIGTAPALTLGGAASITRRGYTDVSASFNSTGGKTVAVTVTGISAGDHMWAMFGSQATTPYQCWQSSEGLGEVIRSKTATRPSTMSSPTSFATAEVIGPGGYWIGS